jgi:hypothetical protein
MGAYLFQIELGEITDEMASQIPLHRAYVNRLFSEGRILSYSVSVRRNMIWCVINAEDEPESMEMVLAMPLYRYFTDINCHPLLFHNTLQTTLPGISLN